MVSDKNLSELDYKIKEIFPVETVNKEAEHK